MMKKFLVFILAMLSIGPVTYGKDLVVRKKAGAYQVEARIDRNPPILGENDIEIEIIDPTGAHKNDAKVMINYYMPPMPRMAPMNYMTNAQLKKGKYQATMNFIMSGPWIVRIMIMSKGKRTTVKFNVDAQ
jgi:hypothetical protein